jgi:hypothetical protein
MQCVWSLFIIHQIWLGPCSPKEGKKTVGTICANMKNVTPMKNKQMKKREYCGRHSNMVAVSWQGKQVIMISIYHKDEVCVDINKVNCKEKKTADRLRLCMKDQMRQP